MAGRNSVPSGSRAGSRRESFDSSQTEPLSANGEFMKLLRRLPDELIQLESEIKKLKREANTSHSRIQQRKNTTEVLQKDKYELQQLLKESVEIATQKAAEKEELQKKLEKLERQLHEQKGITSQYLNHSQRFKQALEEKRKELNNFKERHAAFSERKVRSDQRRTENTLSHNRQSQLESEYVTEFKDGARVDAIDIMTTRGARFRKNRFTTTDYLKCCRFACLIFETAYEVVANMKDSFVSFSSTVLETLAVEAPVIGLDNTTFQSKLLTRRHPPQKETVLATHDVLTELLILVKEEAKSHDLHVLVQGVKRSLAAKWRNERHLVVEYDSTLLGDLNDYIEYCTRFAWFALTQVPPLKIDYTTTAYSSGSHMESQAFKSFETRSPTRRPVYSERQSILCYLWPILQDCDGKVIRKGEVVLNSCF